MATKFHQYVCDYAILYIYIYIYLYSHSLVQFAIIITLKNIYNNT